MVVGMTREAKLVAVDDVMRSLPSVDARCIHIWKTGNVDISDLCLGGPATASWRRTPFVHLLVIRVDHTVRHGTCSAQRLPDKS